VTLKGQFIWERSDGDWEGDKRVWTGSATGSLETGDLEGEGIEERDRKRTFVFSGSFEDGVFTGEHGSLRNGEMRKSGTLTFE